MKINLLFGGIVKVFDKIWDVIVVVVVVVSSFTIARVGLCDFF